MRCGLLLVGLLATDTQAFHPAPIRWGGRLGKKLFLVSKVSLDRIATPQQLTLKETYCRTCHNEIPYFTVNQDHMISYAVNGMWWCLEASGTERGHAVRVNHCTGRPTQKWSWLPHGQIQLEGTNQCIHVNDSNGLTSALVEVSDCASKVIDTWTFEYTDPAPTWNSLQSLAPSLFSICVVVMVAALNLGARLSRWRKDSRMVFISRGSAPLKMDQGGVCLTEPMAVRWRLADVPLTAARNLCRDNDDRCSQCRFDTNEITMKLPFAEDQQSNDAGTVDARRDPGRIELAVEWVTPGRVLLKLPLDGGGTLQVTAHEASEQRTSSATPLGTYQEWRVLRTQSAEPRPNLVQSAVKVSVMPPNTPGPRVRQCGDVLALPYTRSMVSVVLSALHALGAPVLPSVGWEKKLRILCIGLGGGAIPSFLAHHLPVCEVDVVELEPSVVRAATEAMGLDTAVGHLSIAVQDGAAFALDATSRARYLWTESGLACGTRNEQAGGEDGIYDAVLVDAYDTAGNVPDAFTSAQSEFAFALAAGLLRKRGSLIATNLIPRMDPASPLAAYRDALPSGSAGIGFSIQAEGLGSRIAVQICSNAGAFKDASSIKELGELLQRSAAEVGDAIGCSFDMSKLAARNMHTWEIL